MSFKSWHTLQYEPVQRNQCHSNFRRVRNEFYQKCFRDAVRAFKLLSYSVSLELCRQNLHPKRLCLFYKCIHTHTFPVCTVTIGKCIPTLSAVLKCVFNVQCFCLILKKSCIFLNPFYYTILLSLSFLKIFLFKSTFTILCYFDSQNRKKHQQYAILTFLCNDCGR